MRGFAVSSLVSQTNGKPLRLYTLYRLPPATLRACNLHDYDCSIPRITVLLDMRKIVHKASQIIGEKFPSYQPSLVCYTNFIRFLKIPVSKRRLGTFGNISDAMDAQQLNQTITLEPRRNNHGKPVIVGLYGIPGSGKTHLVKQLKHDLEEHNFKFYEGSEMIGNIVSVGLDASGGLEKFKKMSKEDQQEWRQRAIDKIGMECKESSKVGVVAGHYMFWTVGKQAGEPICTDRDLATYTHILYLDTPPDTIMGYRSRDKERFRESATVNHLAEWQQKEKDQLRQLCREHSVLFSLVSTQPTPLGKASSTSKISTLLRDFQFHNEKYNLRHAETKLDEALGALLSRPETLLVLDADKTVAADDTGKLFWKIVSDTRGSKADVSTLETLETLFAGPLQYSYTAFRQATLLYEETVNDWEFEGLCEIVASKVTLYPDIVALLQKVTEETHIGVLILTSGLRRVWEKVLTSAKLSKTVTVIGGGRIADSIVMTRAVKGALVSYLRKKHQMHVWAFGDSPLDLDMLEAADQAIVVVGDEGTRSRSMETELTRAVIHNGLQARQVLFPDTSIPRLDGTRLPVVKITDEEFLSSVLRRRSPRILLASDRTSAKLLMTPTRNAEIRGAALRTAHRRIGWYLATEFVTDVIGLEKYTLPHVLGRATIGYRLAHEEQTLIVALMRGGEPMAMGVSEAFPDAMVAHAKEPDEIKRQNLQKARTLILVDSVINTGKSVVEFVEYIRKDHADLPIVVVANVVQDQSIIRGNLAEKLEDDMRLNLVALRLSTTSFVGSGTTDTGNRLFNTTHLD